jgi:hypothetical protein
MLHIFNKCLGIQGYNLNLITNLTYCWFHVVLITCKYTTLCKKLHCDIDSEPIYLTTNTQHSFASPICKMYRFQVPFVMHYVHNEQNWFSIAYVSMCIFRCHLAFNSSNHKNLALSGNLTTPNNTSINTKIPSNMFKP